MQYLFILTLILAGCAKSDYPSPYSASAKPHEYKEGMGRGLWTPLFVPVVAGDSSTLTYLGYLKPFPQDPKPTGVRPEELLTNEQLKVKEAELTKLRDAQRKR